MLLEAPPRRGRPGTGSFRRSYVHEARAVPTARHRLQTLRGTVDDQTLDGTELLVTELVANCVKHVEPGLGDLIRVQVLVFPEHVRGEVTDRGEGFAIADIDRAGEDPYGGWGLAMLDGMAESWGFDLSHSTRVWFDLRRAADRLR